MPSQQRAVWPSRASANSSASRLGRPAVEAPREQGRSKVATIVFAACAGTLLLCTSWLKLPQAGRPGPSVAPPASVSVSLADTTRVAPVVRREAMRRAQADREDHGHFRRDRRLPGQLPSALGQPEEHVAATQAADGDCAEVGAVWSAWSPCSVSLAGVRGTGTRSRVRRAATAAGVLFGTDCAPMGEEELCTGSSSGNEPSSQGRPLPLEAVPGALTWLLDDPGPRSTRAFVLMIYDMGADVDPALKADNRRWIESRQELVGDTTFFLQTSVRSLAQSGTAADIVVVLTRGVDHTLPRVADALRKARTLGARRIARVDMGALMPYNASDPLVSVPVQQLSELRRNTTMDAWGLWLLTDYDAVVHVDMDSVVVGNPDKALFERADLAAGVARGHVYSDATVAAAFHFGFFLFRPDPKVAFDGLRVFLTTTNVVDVKHGWDGAGQRGAFIFNRRVVTAWDWTQGVMAYYFWHLQGTLRHLPAGNYWAHRTSLWGPPLRRVEPVDDGVATGSSSDGGGAAAAARAAEGLPPIGDASFWVHFLVVKASAELWAAGQAAAASPSLSPRLAAPHPGASYISPQLATMVSNRSLWSARWKDNCLGPLSLTASMTCSMYAAHILSFVEAVASQSMALVDAAARGAGHSGDVPRITSPDFADGPASTAQKQCCCGVGTSDPCIPFAPGELVVELGAPPTPTSTVDQHQAAVMLQWVAADVPARAEPVAEYVIRLRLSTRDVKCCDGQGHTTSGDADAPVWAPLGRASVATPERVRVVSLRLPIAALRSSRVGAEGNVETGLDSSGVPGVVVLTLDAAAVAADDALPPDVRSAAAMLATLVGGVLQRESGGGAAAQGAHNTSRARTVTSVQLTLFACNEAGCGADSAWVHQEGHPWPPASVPHAPVMIAGAASTWSLQPETQLGVAFPAATADAYDSATETVGPSTVTHYLISCREMAQNVGRDRRQERALTEPLGTDGSPNVGAAALVFNATESVTLVRLPVEALDTRTVRSDAGFGACPDERRTCRRHTAYFGDNATLDRARAAEAAAGEWFASDAPAVDKAMRHAKALFTAAYGERGWTTAAQRLEVGVRACSSVGCGQPAVAIPGCLSMRGWGEFWSRPYKQGWVV